MSTATLRPNGTISATGSITGGSPTEHAALSDDSDSTYVTGNAGEYDLATVAMGSGAITKTLAVRFRGRGDTTTVSFSLEAQSAGAAVATVSGSANTTITTYTGAASAVTLTQAQIDALTVEFSSSPLRLMEIYIDLTYVTKPSTAVTAVTDPYTASTTVPIEWTNTLDSDGGGQTRYEVKVFTDAQYGAGGFDPDTSTPYYTTGEVISSLTTADVGPLENSDTYRAYVRVAQTVNGVSHWSAWAFDEFTMSVTTSDVQTVTATATNSTASIEVTVARDTATAAWEYIEIQRSVDAGTTWTDVRGSTYVAPDSTNSHTETDYETPNGQSTLYRARATYLSSGLPIAGAWVESTATSWSSDDVWLKAPNDSSKNLVVKVSEAPAEEYEVRRGVFPVLGAARPVVVSDTRQDPAGTIIVQVDSIANVTSLRSLLNEAVLLVQAPSTWDLEFDYIAPGRVSRVRFPKPIVRTERWAIEYVEVDSPADPDNGR